MASLKTRDQEQGSVLDGFSPEEGLVAVAVFDDYTSASEAGLAVLAMGDAYWMMQHESLYVMCVDEGREAAVCAELEALEKLGSARIHVGRWEYREFNFGWLSFVLYAGLLILCFVWQGGSAMISRGQADAVAIREGLEWWRAVTALTLHADVVHLTSNLVAGAGFAFFVCRFFGAGAGWLLILLSGVAGNVLNAVVYYPAAHFSIGASTAVFGALGLLTGVGVWAAISAPDRRLSLPRWLMPLFGGLTLLGLFGVGDGNVDVAAHISGFLCGVVLGAVGASVQRCFVALQRWKFVLGGLSLSLIACAWWIAMRA